MHYFISRVHVCLFRITFNWFSPGHQMAGFVGKLLTGGIMSLFQSAASQPSSIK